MKAIGKYEEYGRMREETREEARKGREKGKKDKGKHGNKACVNGEGMK